MDTLRSIIEKEYNLPIVPEYSSVIEEEPLPIPKIEKDHSETPIKEDEKIKIFEAQKTDMQFKAFIDGSYRIRKSFNICGVPLYIASVAVVLTKREGKTLKEIIPSKHFTIFLFPFAGFDKKFFSNDNKSVNIIKDFLKKTRQGFSDIQLKDELMDIILNPEKKNFYIWSDITYKGFSESQPMDIEGDSLFDDGKIRARVNSRVRYIMNILEGALVRYYREEFNSIDWILIDGVLNHIIKRIVKEYQNTDKYKEDYKNTIGFIKNLRRQPNIEPYILYSLKENQYILSKGVRTDEEETNKEEMIVEEKSGIFHEEDFTGKEEWGFVYFRLRIPFEFSKLKNIIISKGIVKLQFLATGLDIPSFKEKGQKIANMVFYEKFPFPSDGSRIWNEICGIEETEKIAKARLKTYEQLLYEGEMLLREPLYFKNKKSR